MGTLTSALWNWRNYFSTCNSYSYEQKNMRQLKSTYGTNALWMAWALNGIHQILYNEVFSFWTSLFQRCDIEQCFISHISHLSQKKAPGHGHQWWDALFARIPTDIEISKRTRVLFFIWATTLDYSTPLKEQPWQVSGSGFLSTKCLCF